MKVDLFPHISFVTKRSAWLTEAIEIGDLSQ